MLKLGSQLAFWLLPFKKAAQVRVEQGGQNYGGYLQFFLCFVYLKGQLLWVFGSLLSVYVFLLKAGDKLLSSSYIGVFK